MDNRDLLEQIRNTNQDLVIRINALKKIGQSNDKTMIQELIKILERIKPETKNIPINWSPEEAERIIDLYIIETLNKLGDDSKLEMIPVIIKKATHIIQGPYGEINSAVVVIRSIGRTEIIFWLIEILNEEDLTVTSNIVKVLNKLYLPYSPVFGNLHSVLVTDEKHNYEVLMFKEELETLVSLSRGKIELTSGVKQFLNQNNFERGPFKIKNLTLTKIVEVFYEIWNFDYYIENKKIFICTHLETGKRWKNWWNKYKGILSYDEESTQFIIKDN